MIHSFVSYTVPVATKAIKTATADAALTTATPAAADSATPSASNPALLDNIKQLFLGVASKVTNAAATGVITDETTTAEANAGHQFTAVEETVYEEQLVPCIVTTGQTFAIWLNVLYLAPLTYLFVKFFITSYLRRSGAESARKDKTRRESQVSVAEKAGWDAARHIEAEVYGTGENGSPKRAVNGKAAGSPNGKAGNSSPNGRVLKPVTNQRSRHA